MGGHAAGEIASNMVVEGLVEAMSIKGNSSITDVHTHMDAAIHSVNEKLLARSQEDPSCRGMGATVNVLYFTAGFVTIGHVGDSRTYLIRAFKSPDDKPRYGSWQLTIDHNLGTFVDRGILNIRSASVDEPMSSRERSKLTRGMGVMTDPKPDIYTKQLSEGDVFLTCSDGLHGFVTDRDVVKTLVSGPIHEAPQRLIEIAKAAGAPDNVTVVLSIVSNLEEPLRDFTSPIFESRPYLLRFPNGEIQGPLTANEIIQQWVKRELPGETELASGFGEWVLLRSKDQVTSTYPEFKQDSYLKHIYYETSIDIPAKTDPKENTEEATPPPQLRRFLLWAGLLTLAVTIAVSLFILPELPNALLPAY
jgi:protein phosphatase